MIEQTNELYKVALLTRCSVQYFLSPYIDSEVNHKWHFTKIPCINKGMELWKVCSLLIFTVSLMIINLVISSIPDYFNNS